MEDIRGEKYKLAGISVRTKGTLVDVFATFARVNEDVTKIMAERNAEAFAQAYGTKEPEKKPKAAPAKKTGKPRTLGALLADLEPMPAWVHMPSLSVKDIVEAVVGEDDLQRDSFSHYELTDTSGVIKDLGPEKLALLLVEMGKVRKQVLEEGQETFIPQAPKAAALKK